MKSFLVVVSVPLSAQNVGRICQLFRQHAIKISTNIELFGFDHFKSMYEVGGYML